MNCIPNVTILCQPADITTRPNNEWSVDTYSTIRFMVHSVHTMSMRVGRYAGIWVTGATVQDSVL